MENRAVVTGMGAITYQANNVNSLWENIVSNNISFKFYKKFNKVCGPVASNDTQIGNYQYMLESALKEVNQLRKINSRNSERISFILGTSIGDSGDTINKFEENSATLNTKGKYFGNEHIYRKIMTNLGINGRINFINSACSSSSLAISKAFDMIQNNLTDVVYVVGIENVCNMLGISSFDALGVISKKTSVKSAIQPFNSDSNGFVIGDGCGVIILESYRSAKENNRKIYSEILGTGLSCDAYHVLTPDECGSGAILAMKKAIENSKINIKNISYINAHGTGTLSNDQSELKAIKKIFLEDNIHVTSTKSMTGHLLGACGVIETIISIKSLNDDLIPATLGIDTSIHSNQVVIHNKNIKKPLECIMNNTFAFGGQNVSIIIKKFSD